ncbi:MAG: hypothetical protein DSZ23_01025 [Thermodesulfatator sp.]|nr:MAG: hypothetical protein DSZ23_01025 [Thermodesulfatator sp.]
MKSGLITVDRHGNILYYNIAAQEILGKSVENSYGKPLESIMPGCSEVLESCKEENIPEARSELSIKDNQENNAKVLGLSCFPITDNHGQFLGHGLIFQDITKIKARQEKLQLIDRLAALGEMAAGLAHEIRNPLASISGAAEYLGHADLVLPEGMRLVEIIRKETERLSRLTSTFLLYGRPERKKAESIPVQEEILSILALLQQRKHLSRAKVDIDIPKDLRLTADPHMFRQVMLNLLLNAFQALPGEDGKISISGANSGPDVRIKIKDNGQGMEPDIQKRIFDPFFTTKPEGTGLGLSIVHRIITELGGQITLQSQPGNGTSFFISFPKLSHKAETPQ